RRHKRAWREGFRWPEGPMEPDPELTAHLQGSQCFSMVAVVIVAGLVAGNPEVVKQVSGLARYNPFELQAAQEICLGLLRVMEQARFCGDELRQRLSKLSKLQKTGIGIVLEIALRKRAQTGELRVMRRKEAEIRRSNLFTHRTKTLAHRAALLAGDIL